MKTNLIAIWNWLNGKKTTIGLYCIAGATVIPQLFGIWHFNPTWLSPFTQTLAYIGEAITTGGLIHKGVKSATT